MALPIDMHALLAALANMAQLQLGGNNPNPPTAALVQQQAPTNAPSAQAQPMSPGDLSPSAIAALATGAPGAAASAPTIQRDAVGQILPNYAPAANSQLPAFAPLNAHTLMQKMQNMNGTQA